MMNSTTPQFHTILNQEVEYMNGLLIPVLYLNTVDGIKRMESLVILIKAFHGIEQELELSDSSTTFANANAIFQF
jgi:hypothetical protein